MKKMIVFIFISVLFNNTLYTQEGFKNIITAIEIKNIRSNEVILQWKSDQKEGVFSIYYNMKSVIRDKFILRDSELITSSNLSGKPLDGFYTYEYTVKLKNNGSYYFAILLDKSNLIDNIARGIVDPVIKDEDNVLIPEINVTVQPVFIDLQTKSYIQNQLSKPTLSFSGYLITSLDLSSAEDIFHLKWNVFPKDLLNYVFIVYRSRYPITQFSSPQGLPEYARVTNQFFYEDRNISFETPYYYAIVTEGSNQWNPGINVFTQPAVLLKKAPSFHITPKVEYVKRKNVLPIYRSEVLSEEDIQKAVQQTLSNLQIPPTYKTNSKFVKDILKEADAPITIAPLTIEEITNFSLLTNQSKNMNAGGVQQSDSNVRLQSMRNSLTILVEKFTEDVLNNRNKSLREQENQEKLLLEEEQESYNTIMNKISDISSKIYLFNDMEKKLVNTDHLSGKEFKNTLSKYYNQRDNIRISQFSVKGDVGGLSQRRSLRETNFLNKIKEIQKAESNQMNYLLTNYEDEYKKINKRFLIVEDIFVRTQNLNTNNLGGVSQLGKISMYQNKDDELNGRSINATQDPYNNRGDVNPSRYRVVEPYNPTPPIPTLPKQKTAKDRLDNVRTYYNDGVVVEKVPDISENPVENWIVVKEIWLQNNKEIWSAKNRFWNKRSRDILGNVKYNRIKSKWLQPSEPLALTEGKKAINTGNYEEAIYLLNFVSKDPVALILLGKSYYELGAYRDAFSVFVTALQMNIPESKYWLEITSEKILEKNIQESKNK